MLSRAMSKLRIGFIPEHFSSPLQFAQKHFNLNADLVPVPLGTGALVGGLKGATGDNDKPIDIAIGLTEGFVADLGKTHSAGESPVYDLAGTYVESPLCWAISTGAARNDINDVAGLKGKKVGVSRIGSGSYVMSFVLADQHGWLSPDRDPFTVVPIGDFAALRKGVRNEGDASKHADFFMWEHFTTKHFWDAGEIKRIGEIYTPWASWMIAARKTVTDEQLKDLTAKLNQGVKHYRENEQEAVDYITSAMDYSSEDAREWMKTVRFADDVHGVKPSVVDETVRLLQKAGVLKTNSGGSEQMIREKR